MRTSLMRRLMREAQMKGGVLLFRGNGAAARRYVEADLVIDDSGQSSISMEDYAIALMDEIEYPTTTCRVLSTGY